MTLLAIVINFVKRKPRVSVRNPPILGDLDLELECLQQKLGIEIWNVECKNFLSWLDCGMGFYFSEVRIVEWE